ncbi:MAG: hypothetical protein AB8F78_02265 [Saprospiraceae bacterium]
MNFHAAFFQFRKLSFVFIAVILAACQTDKVDIENSLNSLSLIKSISSEIAMLDIGDAYIISHTDIGSVSTKTILSSSGLSEAQRLSLKADRADFGEERLMSKVEDGHFANPLRFLERNSLSARTGGDDEQTSTITELSQPSISAVARQVIEGLPLTYTFDATGEEVDGAYISLCAVGTPCIVRSVEGLTEYQLSWQELDDLPSNTKVFPAYVEYSVSEIEVDSEPISVVNVRQRIWPAIFTQYD